jgi:hypothetical protein
MRQFKKSNAEGDQTLTFSLCFMETTHGLLHLVKLNMV